MIKFINKTLFLSAIIIFIFFIKLICYKLIYINEEHNLNFSHNLEFAFFGDSHIERNIKNSSIFENFGKSAEPLLFSSKKAKIFCDHNLESCVVLSFDNLSLNHIDKLTYGDETFFVKYIPRMNFQENLKLFLNCPHLWTKSFLSVGFQGTYHLMDQCGYAPMVSNRFHKATNQLKNINTNDVLEDINIKGLFNLLDNHKNRPFYLLRNPLYIKDIPSDFFNINEKVYLSIIKLILDKYKNVTFIDYKDTFRDRRDFFYDWDHLNKKGADSFHMLLKNQLAIKGKVKFSSPNHGN
jgi:hypothetical protein